MKTLVHNQQVTVENFNFRPEIFVGSVEGYAREYNEDPNEAVTRELSKAEKNPWTKFPLAWTSASASCLTDNYPGKAEELNAKRKKYDECVRLVDGEEVMIESKKYIVKVMGSQYSDPIHFKAI